MESVDQLRAILLTLPDIYRSGDIERYLEYYASDMTSYFDGKISSAHEACEFMRGLFANGS